MEKFFVRQNTVYFNKNKERNLVTIIFILEYNKSKENYRTVTECNNESSIASNIKPCFFDVENLGICGQPPYGYTDPLQPCVLIKFNKVNNNLVFAKKNILLINIKV